MPKLLDRPWFQLLALQVALLTVTFALHEGTDWLVFEVLPILVATVTFAFCSLRLRGAALRAICALLAALGLAGLVAAIRPAIEALAYVPRALKVSAVYGTGTGYSTGYSWTDLTGLPGITCSATLFQLEPGTAASWTGPAGLAMRQSAEALMPRWRGGAGVYTPWASLPPGSANWPQLTRSLYGASDDGVCGPAGEDAMHAINNAWRSRETLHAAMPGAVMLLVVRPRDSYAVLIRYVGAASR